MAERRDPLDALGRPITPMAPSHEFAASLRRRLEEELGMTNLADPQSVRTEEGALVMVHLRVADADRAIRFFADLLDWEAERVVFEDHISHYVTNTAVTVRLLSDPAVPPLVPNYGVEDVSRAVRAIERSGGVVGEADVQTDGGGWARAEDDQGVPLLVYRPSDYPHAPPTAIPRGEVGLVFIREDAARAERFYGGVFGWRLERAHPGSYYFDTVQGVGFFDEAAAFGQPSTPSATLYLSVPTLAPVLARVQELGGNAGPAAQDMGPYFSAMCTDDQGTEFGLMSEAME